MSICHIVGIICRSSYSVGIDILVLHSSGRKQNIVQSQYNILCYNRFGYNMVILWLPNYFGMEFCKGIIGK